MTDKPGGPPPKPGSTALNPPPALAPTLSAPAAAPRPPVFAPVPAAAPVAPAFAQPDKAAEPIPPEFLGRLPEEEIRARSLGNIDAPVYREAAIEAPVYAYAAAVTPPIYADASLSLAARIGTYATTTWATFVNSIIVPALIGLGIALAAFGVLGGSIAGGDLIAAATSLSIAPLLHGPAWLMLAIAAAAGALAVSVWSLKDYLFAGRTYLLERLTKNIPKDEATLERTPARYVRFYHGVLQWCGAFAFLCEVVFQLVAFAIITWGIATGFPGFRLFNNPEQLSVANTFLFWVEDAFAIVDGPETLGFTLSPLEPNKAVWAFGLTLIFFKIGVVGLILQLVRTSFTLRPGDISLAWQRAYERNDTIRV
jgi:hypothetical protein